MNKLKIDRKERVSRKRLPVDRTLKIIEDMMEILLNYMVLLCVLTAAASCFHAEGSPVWYWLIPLWVPFYFWVLRDKVKYLSLFLLLHLPAVAALIVIGLILPQNHEFWSGMLVLTALLYTVYSVYERITRDQVKREDSLPVGLAAVVCVGMYFLCIYVDSDTGCQRLLIFVLLYVFIWLMRSYLQHFGQYLRNNRNAAGAMPERSILQSSMQNVFFCSILAVVALGVLIWSPISDWLTNLTGRIGYLLLKAVFLIMDLFLQGDSEEPPIIEEVEQEVSSFGNMMNMGEVEVPLWMQALEIISYFAIGAVVIAVIVILIAAIVRYFMQGFYQTGYREKKEFLREGFQEEEVRIGKKQGSSQSRMPSIGGSPEWKVRRIFWKTVLAEYEKRDDQKFDLSQTARQLTQKLADSNKEEWEELLMLYEKARYSKGNITKEESRQAGVLARRIRK